MQNERICIRDEVSGLKNRNVTGIAHDVWGTGIISKG